MMADNVGSGGTVVRFQHRSGRLAARIGIRGTTRQPAAWCGSTTIVMSRAVKSP